MPANSAGWDCSSFSRSPVLGSHRCNAAVSNTALCNGVTNGVPLPAAIAFLQTPCPISLAWAFATLAVAGWASAKLSTGNAPPLQPWIPPLERLTSGYALGVERRAVARGPRPEGEVSLSLTGPRTFPERGAVVRGREAPRPFSLRLPSTQTQPGALRVVGLFSN
jgi:hypothetical protein